MSAPAKSPRAPRKPLDHRPADVVAAERAETAAKLDVLARVEALLEAKHGPSWRIAGDAARALAEPATLRVLLGEQHPAAGPSASYLAELRAAAEAYESVSEELVAASAERDTVVALLEECGVEIGDFEPLADGIRRLIGVAANNGARGAVEAVEIDTSTPEGILAMLDAAIEALLPGGEFALICELARDQIADGFDMPPRNPGRLAASHRAEERDNAAAKQLALIELELGRRGYGPTTTVHGAFERFCAMHDATRGEPRPRVDHARVDLTELVQVAGQHSSATLLARLLRLADVTAQIVAEPTASGVAECMHLRTFATYSLALADKIMARAVEQIPF